MRRRKKNSFVLLLLVLLLGIGLGYALLTQTLNIIGSTTIANSTWDIHFDNVQVTEGSVSLEEGDSAASIDQNNNTIVNYAVTLNLPGDYYEFTVDVVNAGTIDGMVGEVISNYNNVPISTTNPLPDYLIYSVTYEDGVEIEENHLLEAADTDTYKVRVEFDSTVTGDNLPSDTQTLNLSFGVEYVQADDSAIARVNRSLYGVLKKATKVGTYAKKYTGEHQDSFVGTGTKDIYHWYATSDANGTAIRDKNNVIFAGHCWQMIRTTDTGGVKMIYNGEAVNNQCLNTRGTHIGYAKRTSQNLASNYYYGTSYTYDSTNNVFTLAGTLEQSTWSASLAPNLIGKYTCRSTSETGTCATLYLVESYYNTTSGYLIPISKNSHYSQFGTIEYNVSKSSPSYVGYMYNTVYPVTGKNNAFYVTSTGYLTVNTSYYYSATIDYGNLNAGKYTLVNPDLISNLGSNYSDLVGKYVLNTTGTSATKAYYVTAVDSNKIYYKDLSGGDLNTSLTIGDSYTESGGVYTLTGNVTNVPYETWYSASNFSVYKGKYVCDGNNTSCTNIKHIDTGIDIDKNKYYYFDTTTTWSFAESVSYDGTTYTLTGDIKTFWDFFDSTNQSYLPTHHYTCLGNGNSCTTIKYINYLGRGIYYVQLSGVQDINTALDNMLYANNVNTKNSTIKTAIDAWYAKYLSNYDSYLEDTIFCNNRTIKSIGAWNPEGGGVVRVAGNYLHFQEESTTKDLSCNRATDQFSTLNTSAQLTYKVGLMSSPEMNLLNNGNARATGQSYWLDSPYFFDYADSGVKSVGSTGGIGYHLVNSANGVRPAVSLNPGTTYTSGDGSMASPYIVGT